VRRVFLWRCLYQAAYTPESVAAQIKESQDRIKTVTPALEAMGAKIVAGGYPFGDYDVLVIFEAPDDTTAASVALAVEVGDDGVGGADPGGSGLQGLTARVAALDGTLRITSPPGGGTLVHAQIPVRAASGAAESPAPC
jgi:uncharacterized protein with GYD domain